MCIIVFMDRHTFIIQTIREAGALLLDLRSKKVEIGSKESDYRNVLTSADIEVNDFISKRINLEYPGEIVLSEEIENNIETSTTYWTIDPIDGTSNFARGIPHYAVVIAWVENGAPIVGAVFNPVTRELFSFEKGKGVYLNENKINVSSITTVKDSYVLLHIGRKEEIRDWGINLQKFFLANAKKNINLASSALDLCFLAAGRADIVIYGTMTTRDISVAMGLVREAGGEVYDSNGNPAELSGESQKVYGVANKALFDELKSSKLT